MLSLTENTRRYKSLAEFAIFPSGGDYYKGTDDEWEKVGYFDINAPVYFYSEAEPTVGGKCWHYDAGARVELR